jgi:hypothetical protein
VTSFATVLLLGAEVLAGTLIGGWWAAVARRICSPGTRLFPLILPPRREAWILGTSPGWRRPGSLHRIRWDPAQAAGAGIPLAAALVTTRPDAAIASAVLGWLLLGIAVCDERTLRIPHAPWAAGIAGGLALAATVGGWRGATERAAGVIALLVVLFALAKLARLAFGREPVGSADFGVVACLGAVCGPSAALDLLLAGSLIALAVILVTRGGRPPGEPRRAAQAPFGACLAAAAVIVLLGSAVAPGLAPASVRGDFVLRHLLAQTP